MYQYLESIPRSVKSILFLSVDFILLPICLYLGFVLRYGALFPVEGLQESLYLFPLTALIGGIVNIALGIPRIKLSSYEVQGIYKTAFFAFIMTVATISLSYMIHSETPRSVPLIFGLLLFLSTVGVRLLGQAFIQYLYDCNHDRKKVAIYGAGSAGTQLASALRRSKIKPVLFVDENESLHGIIVSGLPVHAPQKLKELVASGKIQSVLLAIPSASPEQKKEIVQSLGKLNIEVFTLPSYNEIIAGKGLVESLRPVSPDELLGRDKVNLDIPGVLETYSKKSVFISGAGGSIGSELCRQILTYQPKRLVIFEQSELALYTIDQELRPIAKMLGTELVTMIGSVCDQKRVYKAMQDNKTQIVLHAAAYKHVPLVENNELEGLRNNVLGTKVMADTAKQLGVERFILISTDKAVRPTNIMGGSKRLAELVIQDIDSRSKTTLFSMVRFGNVLGSSGSVIPLFRDQIAKGGPVTVTHNKVTRFFMTIPEASRLVLLAGSFSRGGDVFVLNMGDPVSIMDLAKRMIRLSGRTLKDQDNPNGDIEIQTTGLRPGEKLYEELLISDDMLTTPHPKILRAQEGSLSELEIANALSDLNAAIANGDRHAGRAVVERWIEGYERPQHKQSG